jgi:hypothetical protein
MPANYSQLAAVNIARYIAPLLDRRQNPLPENLILLNRTPEVRRTDGEIVASVTRTIYAADIIADDQEAVVRHADSVAMQATKIPNLKHGRLITQEMMSLLNRIAGNATVPGEDNFFRDYVANQMEALIRGINTRKEALLWQMNMDSATYDRLGIKYSGLTWGVPAALKATSSPLWTSTSATPITDIQTMRATAAVQFGKTYNRITMTTADFNYMVLTTQFIAQAQLFSGLTFPAGAVPFANPTTARDLAGRMLGMVVEINDYQYATESTAGAASYTNFLTAGKVLLSATGDDNNAGAREFSNAIVTETQVGNLPGVNVIGGGLGGERVGPVGYATVKPDLNPPNARLWAVQRGFPMLNDKSSTAILTVQ